MALFVGPVIADRVAVRIFVKSFMLSAIKDWLVGPAFENLAWHPLGNSFLAMAISVSLNSALAPSARPGVDRRLAWAVVLLATAGVAGLGWYVATYRLYKPGSPIGYNLGLAGGVMMLTLLLYPLRKRFPQLAQLGSMTAWFRYHMVFGILAPVLILFHALFRPVSFNGKVAFYSMLVVLVSGVVGRFLYRHVHAGLYGRALTLADTEKALMASAAQVGHAFALEPQILGRLQAFREAAIKPDGGGLHHAWQFLSVRCQGWLLRRSSRSAIRVALAKTAKARHWTGAQKHLAIDLANKQVAGYIDAVCNTATLSTWQYLFSLWHLLHIPFLYLLVISAIVHVVAVHMY